MSIQKEGFLSDDIAVVRLERRETFPELFAHAEALNQTAQAIMLGAKISVPVDELDAKLVGFLLFARLLSNFQAVVILGERGLIVEARTVARSCLETLFHMAAALKDAEVAELMIGHEVNARKKMGNWLTNRPNRADFVSAEMLGKLDSYLIEIEQEWSGLRDLGIEDVARRGGLHDMYIWYRSFSGDAAHPTLSALMRYVAGDIESAAVSLQWGPNIGWTGLEETLLLACSFLLAGCVALNESLDKPVDENAILGHWAAYKSLLDDTATRQGIA